MKNSISLEEGQIVEIFYHLIQVFHGKSSASRRAAVIIGFIHFLPKKLYHVNEVASRDHAFSKRHFLCISLITSDEKTN